MNDEPVFLTPSEMETRKVRKDATLQRRVDRAVRWGRRWERIRIWFRWLFGIY